MNVQAGILLMLVLAAALQVAAAGFALALIPASGMRKSWAVVSLALILLAVRSLYLVRTGTSLIDAALALAISALLLAGAIGTRSVFATMRRAKELLDAESQGEAVFAGRAGALIVLLDAEGAIRDVNERTCDVLKCDAGRILGRNWFERFVGEDERPSLLESYRQLVASSFANDEYVEYDVTDDEGLAHTIVWHRRVLRDQQGKAVCVRSAGIDLTERRKLEDELAFRSLLLDHTNDAVLVYHLDGTIVYANDTACVYRGRRREEMVGSNVKAMLRPEECAAFDVHMDTVRGGSCVTFETAAVGADGSIRPLESRVCPATVGGDLVVETARDITERREAEAAIRRLAYSDPLTGLPNRVVLYDRASQSIARARRTGERLAVLFLDLDDLKGVNDTLGHAAGDELLRTIGGRLAEAFRGEDTVARIGGDEFVVLAAVDDVSRAETVAARVGALMAEPFPVGGMIIKSRLSVGVAVFPDDGDDLDALLLRADATMYAEKGKSRFLDSQAAG
jgi:diguanylate cyclase (GGDEF)-like protein/PAS domain S-box-containing protein